MYIMSLVQKLIRLPIHCQRTLLFPISSVAVSSLSRSHLSTQSKSKPSTPNYNDEQQFKAFDQLGGESSSSSEDEHLDYDEEKLKEELLTMALGHVKTTGWNTDAVALAAQDAGLSPSVSQLFKDYDLVHFFISQSNAEFEDHLNENQLNLRQALEWRLQKVVPYASNYSDAIAIISHPERVISSISLLQEIADSVAHHSLKDISTDINWYAKRMAIAGIYVTSELCLIQDKSEGFSETWKFLDRRTNEFEKMKKGDFNIASLPLPELLFAGLTTMQNILGRNARR